MRKYTKYMKYFFTIITLFSILLLGLVNNINFTKAQIDREPFPVYSDFTFIESADNINSSKDISQLEFSLPSNTWNITNIQMNFTDIKLGKEIKDIEVAGKSINTVYSKGDKGYGVEINITEPTTIFGAYIYGYLDPEFSPVLPCYVQITGFNDPVPDFNILASTLINMSTVPMWYYQDFENETILSPGSYYLTLNGSELIFPTDRAQYNWFYNSSSSENEYLHTAIYDGGSWSPEDIGKPFLYKLIQRVDRSLNPEEINMSVDVAGINYPINSNGSITVNENIFPNSTTFNIPIYNNRTLELLFNLSYHIQLKNFLITEGFALLIQDNLVNTWTLTPNIDPCFYNYSITFFYPKNWINLSVEKDGVPITSGINITSTYIFISNSIITEGSSWDIYADSPNVDLSFYTPKLKFGPGQEIQFSILPPIMPGKVKYEFYNSLGFLVDNHTYKIETIRTEEIILTYQLPSNPNEGIYTAFIFWFNATDAGVVTQDFTISVPFILDPMIIVIIAVAVVSLSIFSFTTYKLVKRSKRKHEAYKQSIFNKYFDVLNLDYFIVTHKKSGLNLYEEVLAGKSIDVALIAGFLEAIRSFGIELTGTGVQSQTIKLEYQESKILMSEFKNFRILLIMRDNPSQDFIESIKTLSYDIDNKYGKLIENFNGNVEPLKSIKNLTEYHLQTSLIYPLKIIKQDIKLKSGEKAMVNRAKTIMKKQNKDYFTVTRLLSLKKDFDAGEAEIILNLIKKKVFQPKI